MRWHSPDYVLGQIKEMVYSFGSDGQGVDGIVRMTIFDDVATLAEVRFRRICEMIVEADMRLDFRIETRADCLSEETVKALKAAGCTRVKLGIESGVQDIVDRMNKKLDLREVSKAVERLKRHGIGITGNFICGFPGERDSDAKKTIEFARMLDLDSYSVSVYTAYFGTVDYDKYGGVGITDPAEMYHTNKNLLALSTVKPETVDEFLALNEGRMTR
jgi:anaerobic magnesium-protoporphyrin IX monomethyl ester cyclase